MGGRYWIRIYEVIAIVAKNFITKNEENAVFTFDTYKSCI